MLKLMIADDERVIRETISKLIDWKSIGIELIGICKDGIEAYNMYLDESPDIVLTDIKMPGLNGLQLVEKIAQMDPDTQFIILSGYGEFSFAKQAMKYGIRHYLLKPCNEEQIIASMQEVMADFYHKRAFQNNQEQQKLLMDNLHYSIIAGIVSEGISEPTDYQALFQSYEHLWDFNGKAYELYYCYYLEERCLIPCLKQIYEYHSIHAPGIEIHSLYVRNTLILFFQNFQLHYDSYDEFISSLHVPEQRVSIGYKHLSFPNLSQLLITVLEKIKRYSTIYCMNGLHVIPTCNYNNLIHKTNQLTLDLLSPDLDQQMKGFDELNHILSSISNPDFLKQLTAGLLIRISMRVPACSPIMATEFLLELNQQSRLDTLHQMIKGKLNDIFSELSMANTKACDFIEKITGYVESHLEDPNLTLKWIAENYLYMNVDYVSKKFMKETGEKFSKYLTDKRIQRAKELLTDCDKEKILTVAELVGCGNNPQYFSQIFKKNTGMTPSAYSRMMNGQG